MGVLEKLQEVNALRSKEAFNMPVETTPLWRFAFGLQGETGEVIQDIRKMEEGRVDASNETLGLELADVVIYAELIAAKQGIDLVQCIKDSFNRVSIKKNHDSRL